MFTTDLTNEIVNTYATKHTHQTIAYEPIHPNTELGRRGYTAALTVTTIHKDDYNDIEVDHSLFYSRAWAFWNFQDAFGDNFTEAEALMAAETTINGPINYNITTI